MAGAKNAVLADAYVQRYYETLIAKSLKEYGIAQEAKKSGKDTSVEVESKPSMDLADRTENIIGPRGVAKRFRELYAQYNGNRIKAIFHIFKEILAPEQCENQWCKIDGREQRLDQAIRTSLVLVTEGVVIAPLDGVSRILISKNPDGSEYVDIYYAGPIRAAGGTAAVFPLILGDYAQKLLGLGGYKPTETEVERYVEECTMYDELNARQYKLGEEEIRKIVRGCPVCINGEPTEEKEVEFHRDLERMHTNRLRSGICLVISEGIALKASKILSYSKMLGLDWSWLEGIIKVKKSGSGEESKIAENMKYLDRIAAGRPIFSYPLRYGGFRIRYGRGRNTGIMGKAIHPATMHMLEDFIAVGTQMKIERPGKAAGIFACDSIEGPIVKLFNDSVVKVNSVEEAVKLKSQVKKILYLGDFLVSYGDFRKSGHPLVPAGYCSEWWLLELQQALQEGKKTPVDIAPILQNPENVDAMTAISLSGQLGVPLHPNFLHYYNAIEKKEFLELLQNFQQAQKQLENGIVASLKIPWSESAKLSLERMGVPHRVEPGWIAFDSSQSHALAKTFGLLNNEKPAEPTGEKPSELLSQLSGLRIRDKGGTFVGTRMGRPEAAKERKMVGSPHVLFPIALSGGATRSINKAMHSEEMNAVNAGTIEVEIALFECLQCGEMRCYPYCSACGKRTVKRYCCPRCQRLENKPVCQACRVPANAYNSRKIPLNEFMQQASKSVQCNIPAIVKGVKGMINDEKVSEPLEKGILRAHHNIHVFRDATIRFDMLNAPLTHFKPKELNLSVEQAKALGYAKDMHGKPLERDDQLCELFVQDVIINEESGLFFVRVTQFLDDLLEKFYHRPRYYNITRPQQLIGHLMLGLAPHTSAGVVGRIIGFTKAKLCFAHPFYHLAKRRNIDGDQDSMMMLLDGLLNFSAQYLASSRGNRMDAPLVFSMAIDPREIDDEAYEMETCSAYPIELYEQSLRMTPAEVDGIPRVLHKLGTTEQYGGLNFTHDTTLFDEGPKVSQYVQLGAMAEKIRVQAKLQQKIAAVDQKDALERVINYHFLPDIIGNTRAFSRQTFRCTKCNNKYRRLPLVGKCTKCGGHIILTIAHGSVKKYLEIAKEIVNQYQLSDYIKQRLALAEKEISSVFQNDSVQQKNLFEYVG